MAKRQGNRLAALQIGKLTKRPGLHCDGFGLYLDSRWRALVLAVPVQVQREPRMARARSGSQCQPCGSP